jgi:hypothetical protein
MGLGTTPTLASVDLRINPARTFVTNGPVSAIVPTGRAVYIAGNFTSVGPRTGPGVGIDASTAKRKRLPEVAGGRREVAAVVPDGSGGFYVGGGFKRVGLAYRQNLAHILANGKVDPSIHPNPNGDVQALALSGQTLYVGGSFSSIGGQTRHDIAAIDTTNGQVTGWDPDAASVGRPGSVRALAASGQTVYAGGDFSSIGGRARNGIAALDAASGQATGWNPNPMATDARGTIGTLAVSGQTVYVGGSFTSIGGQPRSGIAALDAATGAATSWDPNPNIAYGPVDALAVSGQTVFAGGDFTFIGGEARNHLAALDATTGQATSWDPDVQGDRYGPGEVYALTVTGQTVYVGGRFTSVGGRTQNAIAAVDATTGQAASWNPNVQGPGSRPYVSAIAVSGQTVYAGGAYFNSIGGKARNGLAAIDPSTGWVTSWNPNPRTPSGGGGVEAIAVDGQTVYAGGWFNSIGDRARNGLAALDATTGEATSWDPNVWNRQVGNNAPGGVNVIDVSGQTVYVGGYFSSVGGTPRTSLAAIDPTTGDARSWNPDPSIDGSIEIFQLAASRSSVYVGGWFDSIGGKPRSRLAAVDTTTGQATGWNPSPQYSRNGNSFPAGVSSLAIAGGNVYVGGNFTSIGGQPRNGIAALDPVTGDVTSWDPNALAGRIPHPGSVAALAVLDSTVYVSGAFNSIGGQERRRIAAVDASTGRATGWTPHPDAGVWALAAGPDGSLWAGGSFGSFAGPGGPPQSGIARFLPKP